MRQLALLLALLVPAAARAGDDVDVALVLVSDVSRSIDDGEFQMEKDGYKAAFDDETVLAAIRSGTRGAIAVSYIEFASAYEVRLVLDWTVIRDAASARAFTEALGAAPRSFYGGTSISAGLDRAVQQLAEGAPPATRRVIDVAGDGTSTSGREPEAARAEALAAGITVNGLAIINDHPTAWTSAHVRPPGGLGAYYRQHVAGGEGSFVLEVHEFQDFGRAMTRKLVHEIAAAGRAPPGRAGGPS